ncbi:unnamed protein product [Lactuca virosa]|uniref:Uncharacterized protein n=1 Tax=Lactuca virosa TaxID=75947 RepID=A0AAU9P8S0_9ASTR|nr:unnamed protein product [Lactuca virosa]
MAESSRRRKSKETKTIKKTKLRYVRDEESDDDLLDLGFLDVEQDNFNPTSNLCDDPFLNILCDNKIINLKGTMKLMLKISTRVHGHTVKWNQMKPTVGELYESPAQLRFALTNYAVANGYQLWFVKRDKSRETVDDATGDDVQASENETVDAAIEETALERINVMPDHVSPVEMDVNVNEIEYHLEADSEEDVNEIEDNLEMMLMTLKITWKQKGGSYLTLCHQCKGKLLYKIYMLMLG